MASILLPFLHPLTSAEALVGPKTRGSADPAALSPGPPPTAPGRGSFVKQRPIGRLFMALLQIGPPSCPEPDVRMKNAGLVLDSQTVTVRSCFLPPPT